MEGVKESCDGRDLPGESRDFDWLADTAPEDLAGQLHALMFTPTFEQDHLLLEMSEHY